MGPNRVDIVTCPQYGEFSEFSDRFEAVVRVLAEAAGVTLTDRLGIRYVSRAAAGRRRRLAQLVSDAADRLASDRQRGRAFTGSHSPDTLKINRAMWVPQSAEELDRAIAESRLPHESASYEYERALPAQVNNKDIGIDVAAMSTEGGIIIYGIDEDRQRDVLCDAAGAKDWISDVVTGELREPPYFDVKLLPLPTDAEHGFAVVDVPASPRAPHMVEVKGEYRYYGRVPGGNTILTESQVAALYERSEREVHTELDKAIALAPIPPAAERGDLHFSLLTRFWVISESASACFPTATRSHCTTPFYRRKTPTCSSTLGSQFQRHLGVRRWSERKDCRRDGHRESRVHTTEWRNGRLAGVQARSHGHGDRALLPRCFALAGGAWTPTSSQGHGRRPDRCGLHVARGPLLRRR